MIAVMAVGWSLMHAAPVQSPADRTAMELYSNHIRSLMPDGEHLMDVASTDRHTVKPWFAGKIDFSPRVEDFKDQGFPLAGGRLDVLEGRPVAALVYKHGPPASPHIINLFISPAERAADTPPAAQVRGGYNIVHWTKSGMTYWAVSSVSNTELGKFAQLVREESPGPSTPRG